MTDRRLIEDWLPIAELGIEGRRERTAMTPFPAPNRLHVWWARRPLVASRAAVLASLLPADADQKMFFHVLGIHGDPIACRKRIDLARQRGERFKGQAYPYPRAFKHIPDEDDVAWLESCLGAVAETTVLDPTAGGGSIPFETIRLGAQTLANELNPVASFVMRATVDWPSRYGNVLASEFSDLSDRFVRQKELWLAPNYPKEPDGLDAIATNFLWARTVCCPYCGGIVPLSPNWRLAPDGTGVRLHLHIGNGSGSDDRYCSFEIVDNVDEQSAGTVARGTALCPFPDCGQIIDGKEIKEQAQSGEMGEQLYAVVYKRRVKKYLKSGKRGKDRWVRGYRAPRPEDDNGAYVEEILGEKMLHWDANDVVPSEPISDGHKTKELHRYGMSRWRDMFSPRQLLCHGTSVEIYREMLEADRRDGALTPVRKAAYGYLAIAIDKLIDYGSRLCVWEPVRGIRHTFTQHAFPFRWSYVEMSPLVTGVGYDWVIRQVAKCIGELTDLLPSADDIGAQGFFTDSSDDSEASPSTPVTITCKSADDLDHLDDDTVDAVVMDPPYYDNVMYAELSDFFYVWLKRTAGCVFPKLFEQYLTDKDNEAVANPARFEGMKNPKALAANDYRERMRAIFVECRRVLKPNGIMTLMFTHKAKGAWDALTTGLIEAGFAITASWPVNTEAPGSIHIKDRAAARSTIFLVCKPRASSSEEIQYWEHVEPKVAKAVRERIGEFRKAGVQGVDLYLASFGPALKVFSSSWPLRRETPRRRPAWGSGRRRETAGHLGLEPEGWDKYAVTPEDALDVARREVKNWRLGQLIRIKKSVDIDGPTSFFVLAWDAFRAPTFPYDEALKLARAIGVDLDRNVVGRMAGKKGASLTLWDSSSRAAKGSLGPMDGSNGMIDALHFIAHAARDRSLEAARELLVKAELHEDHRFSTALKATLEVLPVSAAFTGFDLPKGGITQASRDFDALENVRRLVFRDKVPKPGQLEIWQHGES